MGHETATVPTSPPINGMRNAGELGFWKAANLTTGPVRQISSFPMGPCGRAAVRDTALRCPLPRPPLTPTGSQLAPRGVPCATRPESGISTVLGQPGASPAARGK